MKIPCPNCNVPIATNQTNRHRAVCKEKPLLEKTLGELTADEIRRISSGELDLAAAMGCV